MYEWRIDTAHTASMHLLSANEELVSGSASNQQWGVFLEHSSSAAGNDSAAAQSAGSSSLYCKYGRVTFVMSGSGGFSAIS